MDTHETAVSTVMVFVFAAAAGLILRVGDQATRQRGAFLLGIVS